MMRTMIQTKLLKAVFSSYQWYRRARGGKWMHVFVDHPVMAACWCDVPDWADDNYSEPGWRGNKNMEVLP